MILAKRQSVFEALQGRQFSIYFADDMENLTTPNGSKNTVNRISSITIGASITWLYRGLFRPSSTADYQFRTTSDDASYVWIGSNATASDTALNTSDAVVNNGGLHAPRTVTGSKITLTEGVYYPIAIVAGNNTGPGSITVEFTDGNFGWLFDGTGYYFHNPKAPNGYNI